MPIFVQTVYCIDRSAATGDCLGSIACRSLPPRRNATASGEAVAMHARLEILEQSRLWPCSIVYRE